MTVEPGPAIVCNSSHHKTLKSIAILTGLNLAILIIILACSSWSISRNNYKIKVIDKLVDVTTKSIITSSASPVKSETFKIISRDEWNAQTAKKKLTSLETPVNRVIIFHTASKMCSTHTECIEVIGNIQKYHQQIKRWDDIGANFLIGGNGAAYEGRGWNNQGAHTKNHNNGSVGIAMIGNFTETAPSKSQFDALELLLDEGVRLIKLTKEYIMYPQSAFISTESPGDSVVNVIKDWPHYVKLL